MAENKTFSCGQSYNQSLSSDAAGKCQRSSTEPNNDTELLVSQVLSDKNKPNVFSQNGARNFVPLFPEEVYNRKTIQDNGDEDEFLDRIIEHENKKTRHYHESGRRFRKRGHEKIAFATGLDGQTKWVGSCKRTQFNHDLNRTESTSLRDCPVPPRHRHDLNKHLKPTHKCFHPRHHHTHHQRIQPEPHHPSILVNSIHHPVSAKTSRPSAASDDYYMPNHNSKSPALNSSSHSYNGFSQSHPDIAESAIANPTCYTDVFIEKDNTQHCLTPDPSYSEELSRKKRLELLANIYETVKRVTRPPSCSEAVHPVTPRHEPAHSGHSSSEASPSDSPLSEPAMTGSSSSDHSPSASSEFLVISPSGLGFTWRTRGFSDSQACADQATQNSVYCNKPATSATKMRPRRLRNRTVRRSYPSEDHLISPPPGFEGTSSDEEAWRIGRAPARWYSQGSGIDWTKLTKGIKLKDEDPGVLSKLDTANISGHMQVVKLDNLSSEHLENESRVRAEVDLVVQVEKSRLRCLSTKNVVQVQGRSLLDMSEVDELQTENHMPLIPTQELFYLPPASIREDTIKRKDRSVSPKLSSVLEPSRDDMTPIGTALVNPHQPVFPLKDAPSYNSSVHVRSHRAPTDHLCSTRENTGGDMCRQDVLRPESSPGWHGRSSKDEDEDLNALLMSLEVFSITGQTNDEDFEGFRQDKNVKAKHETKENVGSDLSSSRCMSDNYLYSSTKPFVSSHGGTSQLFYKGIPLEKTYSHIVNKKPVRDKKTEAYLPACVSSGLRCLGLHDSGRSRLDSLDSSQFRPCQSSHKSIPGPWRTEDVNNSLQGPRVFRDNKVMAVPTAKKSREEGWLRDVLKITESCTDVHSGDILIHSTGFNDVEINKRKSPVFSDLLVCDVSTGLKERDFRLRGSASGAVNTPTVDDDNGLLGSCTRDANSQIRQVGQQCNGDSVNDVKAEKYESSSTFFDGRTDNKCRDEINSKSSSSYDEVTVKPNRDSSATTIHISEGNAPLQSMKDVHLDNFVKSNISDVAAELQIPTDYNLEGNLTSTISDTRGVLDTQENSRDISGTIEVSNNTVSNGTKSHLENYSEIKEIGQMLTTFHGDTLQGVTGRNYAKVNYQRSKSLHREEGRGKCGTECTENTALSGSLRELAHLNIDVSQRLVNGECVFLVKNGSPELQVVVNSLTPVLSRRRRTRNTTRTGRHASGEGRTSPLTDSHKPLFNPDFGESAKCTTSSPWCGQCPDGEEQLPMFVKLRSHEGSPRPCSPQIHVAAEDSGDFNKSLRHISEKLSYESNAVDIDILNGLEAINDTIRIMESKSGLDLNPMSGHDDLTEELENNKSSLFLSPKLSHTWHGQSDNTRHRIAPRMGIGQIIADAAKNLSRPIASSGERANSRQQQHSYTLPVISRTLLDAMHKRYCSHQYSRHSHSLKPFTILKIDPASSSRNQPITALRVEPCSVRNHEVHAAPPSPQFIARLRKLNSEFKASTSGLLSSNPAPPSPALRPEYVPRKVSEQHDASECIEASPHVYPKHDDYVVAPKTERQHPRLQEIEPDSNNGTTPIIRSPLGLEEMLNHGHKQAELEAVEALKWLRAAGFPQYAQMFDDGQFPIELTFVEKDHDFLDTDSLKSLFRRLETLNKYAGMKIHSHSRKKGTSEEDEEEDLCALSEKWEYQKSARRWSRKEQQSPCTTSPKTFENRAGSHDSLLADQDSGSQTGNSPLLDSKMPHREDASSHWDHQVHLQGRTILPEVSSGYSHSNASSVSPPLRRAASERVKPTKNLWKKMEGMKSKKSRGGQRNIVEISGPVVADKENMQAKLQKFNCRDISPTSDTPQKSDDIKAGHGFSSPTSPPTATSPNSGQGSPFRSRHALVSQSLKARPTHSSHTSSPNADNDSSLNEFYSVHSQLLQTLQSAQQQETGVVKKNKSDSNLQEIFILPQNHQPGRFPTVLQNGYIETDSATSHGSVVKDLASLPDSPDGVSFVLGHRVSFYDNWLPADGQASNIPEESPLHSSTHETNCGTRGNSYSATTSAIIDSPDGVIQSRSFHSHTLDSIRESRGSSVLSNSDSLTKSGLTDRDSGRQVSDRTEDNNTVSRTLTPSQGVVARDSRLSKSSRESSIESTSSNSGQVTHSASLDSYFLDSESQASSDTLKQDYHEFDLILQQLFDNIKELNSYVTKDKESTGNVTYHPSATTPGGTSQGPLQLAMSGSHQPRYDLDSPVSPTSDLVMSPASPLSPRGVDESIDENSSSGGENQSSGGESSNSGSDDQEVDLSHDDSLDQITEVSMERRDSGVGHSLTRAPGDRRRKKLRWNSFQKCHRPDVTSRAMQINSLSVSQLVRLQKWSLLKLTGIMEKCLPVNKSGWNWMVPRFMKRQKAPDYSDKNVFGVPFTLMAQRTGQPLPQCVLYAMRYLRRTSQNAVGIFRKSGVKSKIQQLRDHLEAHPETTDFEDANAYNVADMLKTYFRDLPECLLTNKMSETFRSIYTYVPQPQRLEAIQAAILLLPDENREVLQSILLFLSDISSHESEHQMNASNLAVCFTPTVFQLGSRHMSSHSPKRNRKNSPGIPDPREILEQKAAHECLLMMITECKKLFTIPAQLFRQLQGQSLAHLEPAPLQDIGNSPAEVKAFGQERIQMVLKEAHDKNRGWIPAMVINDVEIFHRKPLDDCPLKEWKLVIDIEAPPIEVLRRIMHERHAWDEDLLSWSVVERLDPHSDIFQYVLNSMAPHPSRHFCVLRYWRSDLTKGACALITMSVEHSDAMEVHGVWAIDLGSFFLMEPCGSGRSRLTYITRVDTRGRTPEWYTKIYGHICSNFLERLRESFKQDSTGPETKV